MDRINFKVNDIPCSVGCETSSDVTLLDYIRKTLELRGTKYMCREGGCGACVVTARRPGTSASAVNSCLVSVTSCDNWDITTVEKVGNKLDGYHPLQTTLAEHNGTQCGYCTPGWIMSMYSLLKTNPDITMLEIEQSLGGNVCRCTGYRPILEAFKTFAKDAPKPSTTVDIEDLHICKESGQVCSKDNCDEFDWCMLSRDELQQNTIIGTNLSDGRKWFRVKTITDVFDVLKREGVDSYMLVAGNTAKGAYPINEYPKVLIDLSSIKELKGFYLDQNLIIGAGNTLSDLLTIFKRFMTVDYFEYLKEFYKHLKLVAHIAVRNIGTIGGNLMIKHQHNDFPSDLFLMFETVGAQVTIMQPSGKKHTVNMQVFLKTSMKGNIIVNVMLPPLNNKEYKIKTYKVMPRSENSKAIVNAGFLYKLNINKIVKECRMVFGGLSSRFVRAVQTEKFLLNKSLFKNEILQAAIKIMNNELIVTENFPEPSAEYRRRLAIGLFYKGLLSLCPLEIIKPCYRSGASMIHESRSLSSGRQLYDTNPKIWPLNKPVQKVEALIQCSGEAFYTEDLPSLPQEVFAAFVLSTVPTGNITKIDASEALRQPNVLAFYSAKDIPGINAFTPGDVPPLNTADEEFLCTGVVKYYNQPIGVIVAETQYLAEKASKLVRIEYSNVKHPVVDIKTAIKDPSRIKAQAQVDASEKGDDVHKIIKGCHTIYGQYHFAMETLVCVSIPTEEGMEVYVASQWIHGVQLMISRALSLQQNKIDVYVRRLGGSYGIKISRATQVAVACSLVTNKLNKPCRFIMPLTTAMRAVGKRLPCTAEFEVAVNKFGVIQYVNENVYEDQGYMYNEPLIMLGIDLFYNCYEKPKWNYKSFDAFTNTPSNTWCRSPGTFEHIVMAESILERISYEVSVDPIEVRLSNLSNDHKVLRSMVDTMKTNAQYNERKVSVNQYNAANRWKKRGLRFALLRWMPQGSHYHDINLSVYHDDGTIALTHGGVDMGQGLNTKAIQVVAYMLNVPMEKIQVKANSTIITPNSSITGGSLTSMYVLIGLQKCCQQLLNRLAPVRQEMVNSSWEQLIKRAYLLGIDLQAHGLVNSSDVQNYNIYGVSLTEVEVDVLTGEIELLRVDILQDVGRSISPVIDIGQVEGAFIMGLGYWTCENLVYEPNTGELLTDRTWNYKVPLARDIPLDFRVYFKERSFSTIPALGAKCIGEPPIALSVGVAFAIREAVSSSRLDTGIPTTQWFQIDGPWTLEKICLASKTKYENFVFY